MESEHVLRQFTELYAKLHAFPREGGPQISVRCSHLGSGHYFKQLYLTVDFLVLLFREECKQEDILGDGFRIFFLIQLLAWFNYRYSSGTGHNALQSSSFTLSLLRASYEGNKACEKRECFLVDKRAKGTLVASARGWWRSVQKHSVHGSLFA